MTPGSAVIHKNYQTSYSLPSSSSEHAALSPNFSKAEIQSITPQFLLFREKSYVFSRLLLGYSSRVAPERAALSPNFSFAEIQSIAPQLRLFQKKSLTFFDIAGVFLRRSMLRFFRFPTVSEISQPLRHVSLGDLALIFYKIENQSRIYAGAPLSKKVSDFFRYCFWYSCVGTCYTFFRFSITPESVNLSAVPPFS